MDLREATTMDRSTLRLKTLRRLGLWEGPDQPWQDEASCARLKLINQAIPNPLF